MSYAGAVCSLVASPAKTKLIGDPLRELPVVAVLVVALALLGLVLLGLVMPAPEGRKSIQGTGLAARSVVLVYWELSPPVVAPLAELLLPCAPTELLVPRGGAASSGRSAWTDAAAGSAGTGSGGAGRASRATPLTEITAKSIRPEIGLISTSRTVPSDCPDELVTWAPVSWLARMVW